MISRILAVTLVVVLHWPMTILGLRCYTTKDASKTHSVECGLNTGCVKIYIDSEEMLMRRQRMFGYTYGAEMPTLPEQYTGNPVLMRGCFVLAVPDRCYNADNGLSYCWCSTKDLCNATPSTAKSATTVIVTLVMLSLLTSTTQWTTSL